MGALVSEDTPLIGLEPSGILSFKDEYPKLVKSESLQPLAENLSRNAMMVESFLYREAQKGNIGPDDFDSLDRSIYLHGHCHQKALSTVDDSAFCLNIPENHSVEVIPSGCCGMAGSFGYEKDNYDISMQVGELVLFPKVRSLQASSIIAAPGTSCRHQIFDGTSRKAYHPVEILYNALKK